MIDITRAILTRSAPDRLRDLIYQEVVRFHSEKVAAGTPAPAMVRVE